MYFVRKIFFCSLLFLISRINAKVEFKENILHCFSNNTWDVYYKHFITARSITITILITNDHASQIVDFSEAVLQHLLLHSNKAMKLSKIQVTTSNSRKWKVYNTNYQNTTDTKYKIISLKKIREAEQLFSSDSQEAYLIIAWNYKVVQDILHQNPSKLIARVRAVYAILFMFHHPSNNKNYSLDIGNILVTLWKKFNILNVIAQAPCSSEEVYTYKPFDYVDGKNWGNINIHKVDTLLKYPYLMRSNLKNLHGFPVKISMFERAPTVMLDVPRSLHNNPIYKNANASTGFYGLDARIITGLASYLNFKVVKTNLTGNYFGTIRFDGSISGSLGEVVRKEVHISANGRFMIYYGTDEIEFTVPFSNDRICVVVPKSERIPQWMIPFMCFKWEVWLCVVVVMVISTIVWYLLKKLQCETETETGAKLDKVWLEMWSIFMSAPVKVEIRNGHGWFLLTCLMFNVIITGIFQGSLIKSFSTKSYYADINTLEELDESGLKISTSLSVFNENQSSLFNRLKKKTFNKDQGTVSLETAARLKTVAAVERKLDAKLFLKTKYLSKDGLPLLHIVQECPISYFVSYIVPKGSPFLPRFNWIIVKYLEAGLGDKWYDDIVDAIVMEKKFKTPENEQIEKPFSLADIQVAFMMLHIGYVLGFLVFVGEFFMSERKKKLGIIMKQK